MPRSGTEYLFELLHELPHVSASISEPFHTNQIFNIDSDYVTGARKQLDIIKDLSLTNNLLLKEIFIPDIKLQPPLTGITDNFEFLEIFKEYKEFLETNFYKIKLVRNNLFDMALSTYIALNINQWHNANMNDLNIVVDIDQFKDILHRYKLIHDSLINYSGCQETLFYENLSGEFSDDCHLIKCITNPVNPSNQTMFKNLNKRSVIANYDDILKVYYSNV